MNHPNKVNGTDKNDMDYDFNRPPPWYISMALGIQHFLSMCAGNAFATMIIANYLCLPDNSPIKSELISSSFFVMGISSFLQTICGCKLPIIQGASFACVLPTLSLLQMPDLKSCNISSNRMFQSLNLTSLEDLPLMKIRLMNGAIMVSSLVEIIISVSGLLGILTRLISPLSLAAIYTVLSLNISESLLKMMSEQWVIGILGMIISVVSVVILSPVPIPIPVSRRGGNWKFIKVKIFQICPIIISLGSLWIVCAILTASNLLSKSPKGWGYSARTDIKFKAIYDSKIFKIPYPGQWGMPLLIPSAIVGLTAGILISTIESVGDYMITSMACRAPKIPQFAINRGILVEGSGVFLSGLLGAVTCPTSYSGNIGLFKLTKAGNVIIGQMTAFIMLLCGIFPVFGAVFVSIPNSIVGGVLFIVCLLVMGCAINNFQYIDINSTRNVIVFGFSVSFGLYFPAWITSHLHMISVGYEPVDEILRILLSIHLFIVAVSAIVLDNILPGHYSGNKKSEIVNESKDQTKDQDEEYTKLERFEAFDNKVMKWLAVNLECLQILPIFPAYRKFKGNRKNNFEIKETLNL
uniref:Slc23a-1 n=1 Tax=Schmidtea mediterranea TaxID=79327 RepID=A0A0H3YF36_SCHMD|nr:slc23a-1 [Schmidtea mediterranea]